MTEPNGSSVAPNAKPAASTSPAPAVRVTSRPRRSGRLSWQQFIIIIGIVLAAVLILLANVDAAIVRTQVEVRAEKILIDLDPLLSGPVDAKVNIPLLRGEMSGADRLIALDETVLDVRDLMLLTTEAERAPTLDAISIPAGWRVSLRVDRKQLVLSVFPGESAIKSGGIARATFSARSGSSFEETDSEQENLWRVNDQTTRRATVVGQPNRPLTMLLFPVNDWLGRTQFLGLEGVGTTNLQFSDTPTSRVLEGESHVLAATARFADLETPDRTVHFREHLVARSWKGRLLTLAYVPADETSVTDVDPARRRAHLHARWDGDVTALRAGYPGSGRSLLPSMLIKIAGTKQRLYITGVLIYLIIFLSAMVKQSPLGVGMLKHERLMGGGA